MNENLPYDPDLKEAMLKIQEIMDEYKIGGSITLASKTHAEFLYHFPKWSIVQLVKPSGVRIRSKRKDFDSKEEQHKINEESCHLVARVRDMSGQAFMIFENIFKQLDDHFDIEHEPFSKLTPHREN